MKILILGDAQHGKDTFAEMLGISFKSSSIAALEIFLFDELNKMRSINGLLPYKDNDQAFNDRGNWRSFWYSEIQNYNNVDKARLAKDILKDNECYVGMRSYDEYRECLNQNVFDFIFWVDASMRKPKESRDSMTIEYDPMHMIMVDNNDSHRSLSITANMWEERLNFERAVRKKYDA